MSKITVRNISMLECSTNTEGELTTATYRIGALSELNMLDLVDCIMSRMSVLSAFIVLEDTSILVKTDHIDVLLGMLKPLDAVC